MNYAGRTLIPISLAKSNDKWAKEWLIESYSDTFNYDVQGRIILYKCWREGVRVKISNIGVDFATKIGESYLETMVSMYNKEKQYKLMNAAKASIHKGESLRFINLEEEYDIYTAYTRSSLTAYSFCQINGYNISVNALRRLTKKWDDSINDFEYVFR